MLSFGFVLFPGVCLVGSCSFIPVFLPLTFPPYVSVGLDKAFVVKYRLVQAACIVCLQCACAAHR